MYFSLMTNLRSSLLPFPCRIFCSKKISGRALSWPYQRSRSEDASFSRSTFFE
jgi:hypothetical protein